VDLKNVHELCNVLIHTVMQQDCKINNVSNINARGIRVAYNCNGKSKPRLAYEWTQHKQNYQLLFQAW